MASCKYCGQPAGFFSRSHKNCEEKHKQGLDGLAGMLKKYFQGAITASRMGQNIRQNKAPYFLSDDDIANIASNAVVDYTATLNLILFGILKLAMLNLIVQVQWMLLLKSLCMAI